MTLCHNLKSQKSNFYNWISITWQNSIGCKPIRSQYFDWVAYWCSRGQNFISDFLLLYTGSHDSPIWLITNFMSHIGKHYLSNGPNIGVYHWRGFSDWFWFALGLVQLESGKIRSDHQKHIWECSDDGSHWLTNQITQNNIFYLAYSRNVLQPDLVVCNNSLQQSLGSYSDGPDRPSWTATVREDLNCKYDSPKPVLHFSLGRTTITLYRAFFVRTLLMLAHDESYLWVIVHFLRLSDVHECSCSIFLINNAALHLSWLWVIFMTSWEDLPNTSS